MSNSELNNYIDSINNKIILEKNDIDSDDYDENDLLYTNAINNDVIGDEIDKSRYVYTNITYVNIDSRDRILNNNYFNSITLRSSGNKYSTNHKIISYEKLIVDSKCCIIVLKIQYNDINIIINDNDLFTITIEIKKYLTEYDLAQEISNKLNNFIGFDLFDVICYSNDGDIYYTIEITLTDINYKFIIELIDLEKQNNIENSNCYKKILDNPIDNVKSIRLVSSDIQNTDTIINKYNNQLIFRIKSGSDDIILINYNIPTGNYTILELLNTIINGINSIIFGEHSINNFLNYSYNSNTNKITFYTDLFEYYFSLEFINSYKYKIRYLNKMLGFDQNIYNFAKEISNTTTNNFKLINLNKSKYIWLDINDYECIYDTYTQKYHFNKINFCNDISPYIDCICLFENLTKIEYFNIKLIDIDSNNTLFNTNNEDHNFVLEIVYLSDRLNSTGINSKRSHYKL